MRVLIDTHYVLWAAINSKRMEAWARKLIANLDNEILVSAASVYEISLKVRHGKLPEAVVFESDLITNNREPSWVYASSPGARVDDARRPFRRFSCRSI